MSLAIPSSTASKVSMRPESSSAVTTPTTMSPTSMHCKHLHIKQLIQNQSWHLHTVYNVHHIQLKKGTGLPYNYGNNKDVLMIFGIR